MDQIAERRPELDAARFEFGENWRRFARDLPEEHIQSARVSLAEWLGADSLEGQSFLDIGSGSGLFSLAAVCMGAEPVHSLDYDATSVATTADLKRRFVPRAEWTVEQASALDTEHMNSLGAWDIVYSWGVLHHTGDMWLGMANACDRVRPGGRLFISIYNDQGSASRMWRRIKRLYISLPRLLRIPYVVIVMLPMELKALLRKTVKGRPQEYLGLWRSRGDYERGMSRWHDLLDWVGGYPFEVATPEQVFDFCSSRGFTLRKLQTARGGFGCNQFLFELPPPGGQR